MDATTGGTRTNRSMLERVMTGRVSKPPAEFPETISWPSESPAELPETISRSSESPAELPETISRSSESPAEFPETISRSSESPADAPATSELSTARAGNDFGRAYQSLLPELLALRPSELLPVNIGIPGAVTKALGIQPTLAGLTHRIAKALPEVGARLPEKLVVHALALSHAHTLFLTATQDLDAVPSLAAEGKELRAVLLADAQALIRRGQIRLRMPSAVRSPAPTYTGTRVLAVRLWKRGSQRPRRSTEPIR